MSVSRTLRTPVIVRGTGLFTGAPASLEIGPAPAGSGIVFVLSGERVPASIANLSAKPLIPAFAQFPPRHTCITSPQGATLATIEHAMSALAGLGITDATLTCTDETGASSAPEVPILDGSAALFVEQILASGVVEAGSPTESAIALEETIRVERDDASIVITPRHASDPRRGPSYTYNLAYPPPIGVQAASWDGDPEVYAAEIAPARTFSLEPEARLMQSMGLFGHLTPRDMLVIGAHGPIDNALRFDNEPARHKLLDLIGDLALAGPGLSRLRAEIVATRSGHALAHEAARALARLLA